MTLEYELPFTLACLNIESLIEKTTEQNIKVGLKYYNNVKAFLKVKQIQGKQITGGYCVAVSQHLRNYWHEEYDAHDNLNFCLP